MFFQGKNSNVQELILNYILFKAKSKSHKYQKKKNITKWQMKRSGLIFERSHVKLVQHSFEITSS